MFCMKLEEACYLYTHLSEVKIKIYKYKVNISLRRDWKPSNFMYISLNMLHSCTYLQMLSY